MKRQPSRLSEDDADSRASQIQRDSQARYDELNQQKIAVEQDGQAEVDHLKDDYERQVTAETSREESSLEGVKTKGYENIRQGPAGTGGRAIARPARGRRRSSRRSRNFIATSIYRANSSGSGNLGELQKKAVSGRELRAAFFGRSARGAPARTTPIRCGASPRSTTPQTATLMESARKHLEQTEAGTEDATAKADEHFHGRYESVRAGHEQALDRLQADSSHELKRIRMDTAQKLSAYRERQDDPFYKLLDIGAELSEERDHFVLTAKDPDPGAGAYLGFRPGRQSRADGLSAQRGEAHGRTRP